MNATGIWSAVMTAEFNEMGVRFLYPENWEVSSDTSGGWPLAVSVHSPTGAFWSANIDTRDCSQLADEALQAMRREYDELELEPLEYELEDLRLTGYELHFYCLDLLIVSHVLPIPGDERSMVVLYQAEHRDFLKLKPVFDAILMSLLRGSPV
jgi:hypothetical protein